jgi:pentatricopeptide repeat protein
MIRLYRNGVNVKPNAPIFTSCISAWSRCKNNDAPEHAERLFDSLIELYEETTDKDFKPTTPTGSAVITAWARASGRPDSIDRAVAALKKLKKFVEPDLISYNSLLDACGKAGMGQKAMELLEWLESTSKSDRAELQPNIISYSIVLAALAKDRDPGSVGRAERLLERMAASDSQVKPNLISYSSLLDAYGKAGMGQKAMELLEWLESRSKSGRTELQPDIISYNIVITALAKSRDPGSVGRAERLLERMAASDSQVKPNLISYGSLLDAYGKTGMGQKAMELLDWLESTSKSGRAEFQPNIISYNCVLSALAKDRDAGSVGHAERLLERLAASDSQVKPNQRSFFAVIDAIARSNYTDKGQRAHSLMKRTIDAYNQGNQSMKPDVFTFTALIKAYGGTRGSPSNKRRALALAFEAIQSLETSDFGSPNEVTFLMLLRAVDDLAANNAERVQHLQEVFMRCAKAGYVSVQILKEVRGLPSMKSVQRLDPAWIRNVPKRDRPRLERRDARVQ